MKTCDLQGPALGYWLLKAVEKFDPDFSGVSLSEWVECGGVPDMFRWDAIGPFIDSMGIGVTRTLDGNWFACVCTMPKAEMRDGRGPTAIIAIMRCIVSSHYGDEVPGSAATDPAFAQHAASVIESGLSAIANIEQPA